MQTNLTPQLVQVHQQQELHVQVTKAKVLDAIGMRLSTYADRPGHLQVLAMIVLGQAFEICARGANAGDDPKLTAALVAQGLNDTMDTYERALAAHLEPDPEIDDDVIVGLDAEPDPPSEKLTPGENDPRD